MYFRKSHVFKTFSQIDRILSAGPSTLRTAFYLSKSFDGESNETVFENDYF